MPNAARFQSVASLMQREAAAGRYAGVTMVAVADSVIFEASAGLALRSARLPITRDTRFQLASTSKLFTVVAIAQLLEQKVLRLDDPLTKWLPEFSGRQRWSMVQVAVSLASVDSEDAAPVNLAFTEAWLNQDFRGTLTQAAPD